MTAPSFAPPSDPGFLGAPRYRFVRRLGAGEMGVVYEVFDTERRVRMALKALPRATPEALLFFKREFRSLCDLRHPNLVGLGDLVEVRGQWFFTMELVEGADLLTHVRARDPLGATALRSATDAYSKTVPAGLPAPSFDEGRVRSAFRQLAGAMAALHRGGKLHRDLKPSNVLVTPEDRVVVLDFGLVADRGASLPGDQDIVGTVAYMAPEQATGAPLTPAADWYAFGSVLYEALTGRLPFDGPSAGELLRKKASGEPLAPDGLVDDLPPDLVDLCRRLLVPDPAARPDEDAILAHLGVEDERGWIAVSGLGAPENVFVGREAELGVLRGAFERSRKGRAATVVIEGESGVGKSALVDRFVQDLRAEQPNLVVLRSRCREQESVAYKAVDGLMDDLSRALRNVERGRVARLAPKYVEALLAIFPCLGSVRGLRDGAEETNARARVPEPGGGSTLRVEGFQAVAELLRNVASRRPVVAIIDDIQWADLDSLALLAELLDPLQSPPWLLLLTERRTARDSPCDMRDLLRGDVQAVGLKGLAGPEGQCLVAHLSASLGIDVVAEGEHLLADTGGHPLFLTELITHLAQARLSSRGTQKLDDAMWARISDLPDEALSILSFLVIADGPMPLGVLRDAGAVAPEAFVDHLGRLRVARLVRVHGSRRSDTAEPYHDRVREAVLGRLPEQRRRALHGALASALAIAGAPDDRLAIHYHRAGDVERALRHASVAADRLERAGAFGGTAEMLRLVLESEGPVGLRRAALQRRLGEALGRAGRPREAAQAFVDAAATREVDPYERVELERRATEQLLAGGYLEEGMPLARKVLASVGLGIPQSRLGTVASLVWNRWRAHGAVAKLPGSSAPAAPEPLDRETAQRVDVYWGIGSSLSMVDALRGFSLSSAGLRAALRSGDGQRRARALCAASITESGLGNTAEALRLVAATARVAEEDGSDAALFYARFARAGFSFVAQHDLPRSLAEMREAEALWRRAGRGAGWESTMLTQYTCWALRGTGDLAGFLACREQALREARLNGNRYLEVAIRTSMAEPYLMADQADEAAADVVSAARTWLRERRDWSIVDFWSVESRSAIWAYREGSEEEADTLEADWARFEGSALARLPLLASLAWACRFWIALRRGRRAGERGERAVATRHFQRAREAATRVARIGTTYRAVIGAGLRRLVDAVVEESPEAIVAALLRVRAAYRDAGAQSVAAAYSLAMSRVLDGEEGRAAADHAEKWLLDRGVRRPEAFARTLCPF